jgi:hypothetical protein
MMIDLSNKKVCIVDNGIFPRLAWVLAKKFKEVFYTCPSWVNAFPRTNEAKIGAGIEGVTVVDSLWDVVDAADLFAFPDVFRAEEQKQLAGMGKRVWGSRDGEKLELDRIGTRVMTAKLGLPVPEYVVITGIADLRLYLKEHKNVWVKPEGYSRGHFETFKSPSYEARESRLNRIEFELGPEAKTYPFCVDADMPDMLEFGIDGYCVDGQFPSRILWGPEIKGCGYVGRVDDWKDIPCQMTAFEVAFGPWLASKKYRNFYSSEDAIGKNLVSYRRDPCARMANPPGDAYMSFYENTPEIMWWGSEGKLIDPICAGKWAVQIQMHSSFAEQNHVMVSFPPKLEENVAIHFGRKIKDGMWVVLPQSEGNSCLGSVIAWGDSMREAISRAKEVASHVDADCLDMDPDCLDKAADKWKAARDMGLIKS